MELVSTFGLNQLEGQRDAQSRCDGQAWRSRDTVKDDAQLWILLHGKEEHSVVSTDLYFPFFSNNKCATPHVSPPSQANNSAQAM